MPDRLEYNNPNQVPPLTATSSQRPGNIPKPRIGHGSRSCPERGMASGFQHAP